MRIIKKILLYVGALLHMPFTLVRVAVATTLLIDLWCDKVINGWLEQVENELKDEE
tara:strand:- start:459 stop:626 length:168 start_codon:yes stop_codon:yes gene_type:complete